MKLYRLILWFFTPILIIILLWRLWKKKEDSFSLMEKLGFYTNKKKHSQVIWIHAVSVGEMMIGLNIAKIIHEKMPYLNILVTSTTLSSSAIFKKYADLKFMQHAFLPLDHPWCVNRFFSYFKLKFGVFIETSFWPVLLFYGSKKITLCLLNGKMSQKSYLFWLWNRQGKRLIENFSLIYALNQINAKRFLLLGGRDVRVAGYIKFLSSALPCTSQLQCLQEKFSNRLILVVASVHAGEEKNLFIIYSDLKKRFSNLLMIIAPRHMHDTASILLPFTHQSIVFYSKWNGQQYADLDILVIDSIGHLGDFFRIAHVVFVGGSFQKKIGSHNFLEPLKCGVSTVIGPFAGDLQDLCDALIRAGALHQKSADDLGECIGRLLRDQEMRKKQIIQYQNFEKKCLKKIQEMINTLLTILKGVHGENT